MNLSTVKWAQWDKTQSRELLSQFICALHCAQVLRTILHTTDLIIFPLTLQTFTIAPMMSVWGTGVHQKEKCLISVSGYPTNLSKLTLRYQNKNKQVIRPTDFNKTETFNHQNFKQLIHESLEIALPIIQGIQQKPDYCWLAITFGRLVPALLNMSNFSIFSKEYFATEFEVGSLNTFGWFFKYSFSDIISDIIFGRPFVKWFTLCYRTVVLSVCNRQTDRQKTQRFSLPQRRVKSEPRHQTWHGDRGPQARSCASKTFGVWCIVSPLGGAENLGVTRPRQLKTPITPLSLEQLQRNFNS